MNWPLIQQRLGVTPDGDPGPITYAGLFQHIAGWSMGERALTMGRAASRLFPAYEITTPLRLAHWFSQFAHESAGFRLLEENLNYSAEGLTKTWPNRFPAKPVAGQLRRESFARNPRAIANAVYGGRMGNIEPDDGWRFRGRGPGLTGRTNYAACAQRTGLPLLDEPDLAAQPDNFVHIAADYWGHNCLNPKADADDIRAVTKAINGGLIGLEDRQAKLAKMKAVLL